MNNKMNGTPVSESPTPVEVDFEPLWDWILLDPIKQHETQGGILLPDGANPDNAMTSVCVKAGPGAYRDGGDLVPNPIQVGDFVYHIAQRKPNVVTLSGRNFLYISARDCIAIKKRKT